MCGSRDTHSIIAYCLVCFLAFNALQSRADGRVGGVGLCHYCLGRKYTEVSGGLWASAFVMLSMFQKV